MTIATIIIPVYNSASTIQAAITSAAGQTLKNIEVLVVDDGSTDDSSRIIKTAAASDDRLRIITRASNSGKAAAMNHAMGLARGSWLAILDADDTYHPDRLRQLIELGEESGADMVADDQVHIDSATGRVVTSAFEGRRFTNPITRAAFVRLASHPHNEFDFGILKTVIRTDFVRRHALRYHEATRLGEDFYFLMEFFVRGGRLWICHNPLYNWTLPFSPTTRRWTTTGLGPWRYDYRRAFPAHDHYVDTLSYAEHSDMLGMLKRRGRRMRTMIHYTDAQMAADAGRPVTALATLALHPSTYPILARRILRRHRRKRRLVVNTQTA